jgi:hypothetical protein
MIVCPVEYLHFAGDKAQRLSRKEEGCQVKGNDGCLARQDMIYGFKYF